MNPVLQELTREHLKKQVPDFRAGDTLRVAVRIVEGDKERIQNFEGVCIARHGAGMDETFMVRRVSYGIGMERIFALHSPRVESISVLRQGRVRRAKLYYLRDLTGKKARLSQTRRKRFDKGHMHELIPEAPAPEAEKAADTKGEADSAPTEAAAEASSAPEAEAPGTTEAAQETTAPPAETPEPAEKK